MRWCGLEVCELVDYSIGVKWLNVLSLSLQVLSLSVTDTVLPRATCLFLAALSCANSTLGQDGSNSRGYSEGVWPPRPANSGEQTGQLSQRGGQGFDPQYIVCIERGPCLIFFSWGPAKAVKSVALL